MRNYIQELETSEEIEQATTIFDQYKLADTAENTLCSALDVLLLIDQNSSVQCVQRIIHAALRQIRINNAK